MFLTGFYGINQWNDNSSYWHTPSEFGVWGKILTFQLFISEKIRICKRGRDISLVVGTLWGKILWKKSQESRTVITVFPEHNKVPVFRVQKLFEWINGRAKTVHKTAIGHFIATLVFRQRNQHRWGEWQRACYYLTIYHLTELTINTIKPTDLEFRIQFHYFSVSTQG